MQWPFWGRLSAGGRGPVPAYARLLSGCLEQGDAESINITMSSYLPPPVMETSHQT